MKKEALIVLVLGIGLSGCSLSEKLVGGPALETEFEVATELRDGDGADNEVDQEQLEESQKVDPKNDDIDSIESDIDSTVILKEDFSDL